MMQKKGRGRERMGEKGWERKEMRLSRREW
jgi:hypothetical protein